MQHLHSTFTTWHITFGTYGTRLHGDQRPTVDRDHNQRGTPFLPPDPTRANTEAASMKSLPVLLTPAQQNFIQSIIPEICVRGGWLLRTCAAAPDHVHILLDIAPQTHGDQARRLIKRWLTQALNTYWPPPHGWWAEEGSNKPVKDVAYLNAAYNHVHEQRATPQ